jgi:hypothetical protein
VSARSSLFAAAAALVLGATLTACGSSVATPPPPAGNPAAGNPTAAVVAATATVPVPAGARPTTVPGDKCPSAATVGAALGVTLPKPAGIAGGTAGLPAGATAMTCEYAGKSYNVLITLITNVPPSDIALFSARYPVPYQNVSGVGDQARAFQQSLGAGKDNEGLVATKGSNLVSIGATATPASLAQLEALANQLL